MVFIFMDCTFIKAPRVRLALGLTLALSLLDSLWRHSRADFPSMQAPIVPEGWVSYFQSTGSAPKQQYISTFDFSVLSLLANGIVTTIKWPHKLAFIRLRADRYGVAAAKEAERLARRAKAQHRRVHSIAKYAMHGGGKMAPTAAELARLRAQRRAGRESAPQRHGAGGGGSGARHVPVVGDDDAQVDSD